MTASDSNPGSGENTSEIATDELTDEQRRLSDRFAAVWDGLRLRFIEAGKEIEAGEADAETVDELREELIEAVGAVDELEQFVEDR